MKVDRVAKILRRAKEHVMIGRIHGVRAICVLTFLKASMFCSGTIGVGCYFRFNEETNQWSTPVSVFMTGVGIGMQGGACKSDTIILIRDEKTAKVFESHGQVSFGICENAVGFVGSETTNSVASNARSVGSYEVISASYGLMTGFSLEGCVLCVNSMSNRLYYRSMRASYDAITKGKLDCPSLKKAESVVRAQHALENFYLAKPIESRQDELDRRVQLLRNQFGYSTTKSVVSPKHGGAETPESIPVATIV